MGNTRVFLQAVRSGTLVAAFPGFMFSWIGLLILFGDRNWYGLLLFLSPLIIAGPVVLGGCVLIGLPVTAALVHFRLEQGRYYVQAGFLAGASPTVLALLFPEGLCGIALLGVCGGLGGAVSGWVWGRHRDAMQLVGTNSNRG